MGIRNIVIMACFDARVEMFYAAHGKTQAECRAMPAVPEGVLQHYKRSAKELGPADYSGLAHAGAIGQMRASHSGYPRYGRDPWAAGHGAGFHHPHAAFHHYHHHTYGVFGTAPEGVLMPHDAARQTLE